MFQSPRLFHHFMYLCPSLYFPAFIHNTWPNEPSTHYRCLAASSATAAEEAAAKELRNSDPSARPVEVERRIWRPQVTSQYKEPDCIPDPLSDLEILFENYGKPLWVSKSTLPPREDIIKFNPELHQAEFDRNIQWRSCPVERQEAIQRILIEYWDVFAEEGVRKNIRGVQLHVDTGESTPVCVRNPRYGPHETRVIMQLPSRKTRSEWPH